MVSLVTGGDSWASSDVPPLPQAQAGVLASGPVAKTEGVGAALERGGRSDRRGLGPGGLT